MWITAFLLGLTGSIHCLGMCSPLALVVANYGRAGVMKRVIYNSGRVLTYAVAGMLLGSAGSLLSLDYYQIPLSIGLGLVLLVAAVFGLGFVQFRQADVFVQFWTLKVRMVFTKMLRRRNQLSIFVLGSINGLLPCGLTLLAFTFSVGQGSALGGFIFMLLFGLGTLPVMLGLTSLIGILMARFRINYKGVVSALLFLSGLVMILRGVQAYNPEVTYFFSSTVDVICH